MYPMYRRLAEVPTAQPKSGGTCTLCTTWRLHGDNAHAVVINSANRSHARHYPVYPCKNNKLRGRRVRPTRYASARVQEPNFIGRGSWYTNRRTSFEVPKPFLSVDMIGYTFSLSSSRAWPLIFWPWNWCALLLVASVTYLTILMFLGIFVLDLWANTCQAHHVTSRP